MTVMSMTTRMPIIITAVPSSVTHLSVPALALSLSDAHTCGVWGVPCSGTSRRSSEGIYWRRRAALWMMSR